MAPTPIPRNLMHSGTALPLTLKEALIIPPTGEITIVTDESAVTRGWPAIPVGEAMVITIGRGTQYESKYLVSAMAASTDQTVFTVADVDREYDGTTPVDTPVGVMVEHTISATEMQQINTHMRSKQAHGSDGDLVDTNSAQTLANKTFDGAKIPGMRVVPVGTIMMWPSNAIPSGWLKCDGATFSAATYPQLSTVLGGTVLPNLSDVFVKGAASVNLSAQSSHLKKITGAQLPAHSHGGTTGAGSPHGHSVTGGVTPGGGHNHGGSVASATEGGYRINYLSDADDGGAGMWMGRSTDAAVYGGHSHGIPWANDHGHGHNIGVVNESGHTHSFTTGDTGGGADFDVQPKHVSLIYIICATD